MAILFTKFCGRATLIAVEAVAVIVGLLALTLGLLIWRVNSGPLDVTFAKDYVQESMRDPGSGYSITVGTVTTVWPDLKGPLLLRLQNVSLLKYDRTVLNVGTMELALSKSQLLLGQVAPQGIILSNPSLRLLRTENNNIVLSLRDELPDVTAETEEDDNALMGAIRSLAQPAGTLDKRSPFERLKMLEIKNARMVMEDHAQGMTWYLPDLDLVFMRDSDGLLLTANMALPSEAEDPSRITADIVYNRERDDIGINLDLKNVDPHILTGKFELLDFLDPHDITVDGEVRAVMNGALDVEDVQVNLSARPGHLDLPDIYNEPFAFDSALFQGHYDRDTNALDITNAAVTAHGVTVNVTANMNVTPTNLAGTVTATIPLLPQDKITLLWPDSARDESAATWLTQNISGGNFRDVTAGFAIKGARVTDENGEEDWAVDVADIIATLAIESSRVDYRAPLPAAEGVQATGRYENDNLVVTINEATVGGMKVGKASVELTEMIYGTPGGVKVALDLSGSVNDVFKYIAYEPISMTGDQLGLDIERAKGNAELHVDVSFPALRDLPADKVKVAVKGTLTDTFVPAVVKDLPLTGGPLTLVVDNEKVKLSGKGKLDGRDVDLVWEQYLESKGKPWSGKVEASLIADKAMRDKLGITIDEWMDGAVPVNVTYTDFGGGKAEARVRADLMNAKVMVKPFNYEKPPGLPGSATTTVLLQNGELQEIQKLSVQTPDLNLDNARLIFKTEKGESVMRQAAFPRATLGENDIGLNLEVLPNGTMKMAVTGAVFDARPFLNKDRPADGAAPAPYTGPAILATINVDRMRTHPGRMVEKAKLYLDMAQNGDIRKLEMDATAGRGAVYFRLRPNQSGIMTVRLEADDAGATMNAFGIYENISGGKLIAYGEAPNAQNPRLLSGQVQLNDFNAVNAPILARLVSAISPVGIAELLGNDGIYFTRLESKFDWHMRKQGDLFVISGGRTSGSSLGLTFEGNIDKATQQIDINGHVVPVSLVNNLLSSIPIVGTILSGGSEGGVFAATYTITGPQKTPTVSVNPLSVLAPGIIRRILFENE